MGFFLTFKSISKIVFFNIRLVDYCRRNDGFWTLKRHAFINIVTDIPIEKEKEE